MKMRVKNENSSNRVYRWEDKVIHPTVSSHIAFENVQSVLDHVWAKEGQEYPPRVAKLAPQNGGAVEARANRFKIWIRPEGIRTTVLLHEIAHSLMPEDGHNSKWLGVYITLLSRYIPKHFNKFTLFESLQDEGLKATF